MAGSASRRTVRVVRATQGERFYTWRGRVRELFPQDGRLVLNAYLAKELAGSAIVSAHEADEGEQSESAWTLADGYFSRQGRTSAIRISFPNRVICISSRSTRAATIGSEVSRMP